MVSPLRGMLLWEFATHLPDLVASLRGSCVGKTLVTLVPRLGHDGCFAKCEPGDYLRNLRTCQARIRIPEMEVQHLVRRAA